MGAAEPQGEHRQGKTNSPRAKGPRALAARLPRSVSTKKGAWGEGTARTQTAAGEAGDRVDAAPEGGAAPQGSVDTRAAVQQLPPTLPTFSSHQVGILLTPWLLILWMTFTHGVGMPAVFTPLKQLPVQLRQAPAIP